VKGKFITFEGTEGSGKTSIIRRVADYFIAKGYIVVMTREPGGTPIAEKIRSIILDKSHTEMDAKTEALLFAAARRQHIVEKIVPALEAGSLVFCDRAIDSSLVYQGVARKLGVDQVLAINQYAIDNIMPDLTVLIDVRPEVGLARVFNNKGREVNRLDLENHDFYHLIYNGYQALMKRFPDRIIAVNGEGSIDEVSKATIELIEKYI